MRPPPLLVAVVAALNIYLCDLGIANPALILLGGFCCDAWDVARCSVVPMRPVGESCTCAEGRLDGPEGQPASRRIHVGARQ